MDGRVLFTDEVLNMRANLYCFRGFIVFALTWLAFLPYLLEDGWMGVSKYKCMFCSISEYWFTFFLASVISAEGLLC